MPWFGTLISHVLQWMQLYIFYQTLNVVVSYGVLRSMLFHQKAELRALGMGLRVRLRMRMRMKKEDKADTAKKNKKLFEFMVHTHLDALI